MDHEQGSHIPLRGSIPRLSRLPIARAVASNDNLKLAARSSIIPGIHGDDLRKNSHLPRPSDPRGALGDNINQSIRSRYGLINNSNQVRSASPVRDALYDAQSAAMDTTPPGANLDAPVFEDGNENPTVRKDDLGPGTRDKRKPRPSLSERTIDTLSQGSPCPSPVPRRTSVFSNDGAMVPPARPGFSMRESQPSTPTASRPDSPSKKPFRPPGRISPTKDIATLPPVVSPGDIYTPPKAFVRGQRSRIAKPLHDPGRSVSSALEVQSQETNGLSQSRTIAQTMKIKSTDGRKSITPNNSGSKPPLSSIFKDPSPTKPAGKLAVSNVDAPPALLKPRSRGENTIAPSTPPTANSRKSKSSSTTEQDRLAAGTKDSPGSNSAKSSAALRETISKAKAARKKAMENSTTPLTHPSGNSAWAVDGFDVERVDSGDNKRLLRNRIQQAVTSGHLSIAGMSLKRIPPEVMKMYEPENSTINWAEMVDLVKLNAADNDIEELGDDIFPDYTESDFANDDEKSNQFGGLEQLDLHRNQLQHLPVGLRRLERLHTLNLSNNKLSGAVFEIVGQIPQLKELVIGENLINGTLELMSSHLEHLQILDLHGNGLQNFGPSALSQLRNLRKLDLAGNRFETLPWESLSILPLTELNVSKNRLSGVLFHGSPIPSDLRIVDASYNALEEVTEGEFDLPNLRSLTLDGNRLARLPDLTRCKNLQTLRVAENQLNEIPMNFSQMQALKNADFGHNNIRSIPPEVARMDSLSSLTVVGNPLRERKYLTMSTTELKSNAEKKLDQSLGTTAPSGSTSLSDSDADKHYRYKPSHGILDLSSQGLTSISNDDIDLGDSNAPIHTLKLSNNELSTFPVDLLSHPTLKYSLQSLDLSHNPLLHPTEYLSSELFLPSLKSLYIVSTGLTSLDGLTTYLKAPELLELNISCHRLTGHVPWVRAWWSNCRTLLATDNWFTSVDLEGVRGLEVLDIRNNEIETLPPKIGLLGNHPPGARMPGKLRVLEVSGNKFRVPRLTVIEKGTEAVLKDLRRMIAEEDVPDEWKDMI
ncbi:uncharacterized protein Z518_05193 [Rhinocladiella mackenziei CBS 650.93]|uniref:Leucine-rich repeat-containing protein 40 n=1 Tax=Rhinocladiella mackenziei CBS 650.93 TaxID=1442369 RepID=A0A0D2IME2_9EURO|nr:uncharacterized protein Z518_05193 [Rhinocladiella mackenziei CBS 650.93]KIX04326.1 hypothetical protein Z518_05193 [Rhinocladiella mackenziei CBS 650.93]